MVVVIDDRNCVVDEVFVFESDIDVAVLMLSCRTIIGDRLFI